MRKILRIIGVSSVFSFLISEVLFLYFLFCGVSGFPRNIVVIILLLSIGYTLIGKFYSGSVGSLTYYTSILTLIFMVNWFFQSSTDPSILAVFFNVERGGDQRILLDYLVIGLVGGTIWLGLLASFLGFLGTVRKMSIRDGFLLLRTSVSRIVEFFDAHPWLAPVLLSVATLLVGFLIGIQKG